MKNFKVTIIGNSVALRTRPHLPDSKNYGQLLEEKLGDHYGDRYCRVDNRAFSRATILDTLAQEQLIIREFPDVYVINVGVCDAATREIPLWLSNLINSPKGGFLRDGIALFHYHFIKPYNAFFTRLRGKRAWISPDLFRKMYTKLLHNLQHNTNARIICLGINLADERVESIIPGSAKNYHDYSIIIKNCAEQAQLDYVDTHDLQASTHYPDGTHFNDAGHLIIAERLLDIILHENR